MVFLVPFDGSPPARAALDRAVSYGAALDTDVVAVAYVPTGADYVERRRWLDPTEDFVAETVADDLERKIAEATDDAERTFEYSSAQSPDGGLSEELIGTAADVDAAAVFVAGESDAEVPVPVGADAAAFDVHVVRRR
jgi:nucleotide-binding universal stress UspA family protein